MLTGLCFLELQMIQRGPWALVLAVSFSLAGTQHHPSLLHTCMSIPRKDATSKGCMVPGHDALTSLSADRWVLVCLCRPCCSRLEVPGSPTGVPAHLPSKRL